MSIPFAAMRAYILTEGRVRIPSHRHLIPDPGVLPQSEEHPDRTGSRRAVPAADPAGSRPRAGEPRQGSRASARTVH